MPSSPRIVGIVAGLGLTALTFSTTSRWRWVSLRCARPASGSRPVLHSGQLLKGRLSPAKSEPALFAAESLLERLPVLPWTRKCRDVMVARQRGDTAAE